MASTSSSIVPPTAPVTTTPLPSRNPLPLSASQEGQVRELYYKRVRTKCADEVRDFASCATHRTFSATFACRSQRHAMNKCMNLYATREEQDAAREEWFSSMDKRREEREEKERKRIRDEVFWKDWWDKDKKTKELGDVPGAAPELGKER
ncbi:hypothetical protein B0A48_03538 [Cryoendolithus antarcticus]|uniref:COX assembly mitochondrial protein n=1 Tax=Cryoendolithus antarcticus TaxID=1507870 RepID=A0A1V8TKN3_9PEZI|nr:hypothetical protein B0A48_03538 [Cryoendolithus antarcticus]